MARMKRVYDLSEMLPDDARVTTSASPKYARSECCVAIDPANPDHVVAASKKFSEPSTYTFTLATYWSADGGQTWSDSASLAFLPGWSGTTDPALAWDDQGNVYLVALPFGPGTPADGTGPVIGLAVYRSTDGGRTWSPPLLIHTSYGDDKQWAAGDAGAASPHRGNVYAAWDDVNHLCFARTTDHGATWKGAANGPPGTILANDSFSPDVVIAPDGTLYLFWTAGNDIKFVKSTDGGGTFTAPAVAISGITTLTSAFPGTASPHFPGSTFRIFTLVGAIATRDGSLIVTWADGRGGQSRIYYRRSTDGGVTWEGPAAGRPLVPSGLASDSTQHEFHPQPAASLNGTVAVAFYVLGPEGNPTQQLIDVDVAGSSNDGASFEFRITVTDQPWDPAIGAPLAHGNPLVTFIGEYFGLDCDASGYYVPVWTDTRTGSQELFSTRVLFGAHWDRGHKNVGGWNLIGQSRVDGPGAILLPDGRIILIPRRGPLRDVVDAMATHEAARHMKGQPGRKIRVAAIAAMKTGVKKMGQHRRVRPKRPPR
ncbi:MAG TPA: sialidase family protein [Micropepsaceae bacterium]|nr:sialidase family protein [Micropepsaceae bacterium]